MATLAYDQSYPNRIGSPISGGPVRPPQIRKPKFSRDAQRLEGQTPEQLLVTLNSLPRMAAETRGPGIPAMREYNLELQRKQTEIRDKLSQAGYVVSNSGVSSKPFKMKSVAPQNLIKPVEGQATGLLMPTDEERNSIPARLPSDLNPNGIPSAAWNAPQSGYGSRIGQPAGTINTMDFRDSDKDGTDDRYQTGPGQPRGGDKPAGTTSAASNYPAAWGTPPKIQTRDRVSLPMGGMGSSTMRNWQNEKMKEFGTTANSPSQTKPVGTTPVAPPMDRLINRPSGPVNTGPRMPSPDGSHLGPDGWKTPRPVIGRGLPPPETISSKPSWETVGMTQKEWENAGRPSKGDTIKPYSQRTKAELFKLDEKLEDAQRRGDSKAVKLIQSQMAERNNITKALNAGLTMKESEEYAERKQQEAAEIANRSGLYRTEDGPRKSIMPVEVQREPPPAVPVQKGMPIAPVRQGLDALSPAEQSRLANANPQEYDRLKKETLAKRYADPNPREPATRKPAQREPANPREPAKGGSLDADVRNAMSSNLSIASAARNKIAERAALGDPKAANALNFVPNSTGQLSQQAAQRQQMAAQAAQQTAQQNQQQQQLAQARDAAARQLGFKDAKDAESKGVRIGNVAGPERGGGGGGRGGGRPPAAPRLTAAERNSQAAARAAKEARRVDSKGYSDAQYESAYKASAEANESQSQLNKRLSGSGLNPDYNGHFDRPGFGDEFRKSQEFGEKNAAAKQKRAEDAAIQGSLRQSGIEAAREKLAASKRSQSDQADQANSQAEANRRHQEEFDKSLDAQWKKNRKEQEEKDARDALDRGNSTTGMSGGLINYLKRKKEGLV